MIEGFGPGQAVGGGGYVFVNDMFYAELSGYGSLTPSAQTVLWHRATGFLDQRHCALLPGRRREELG